MPKEGITPRAQDYSQWYLDIVQQADLADYAEVVKGCIVFKPTGYALWEAIQRGLDDRIKATGHVNAYFPLLIPKSFLMKEAEHVEGFAPEVAEVTRAGGEDLAEPYVIRPTSETIIGYFYSKWVRSYRDLPLLINQWANVMRWEMRTRPFLRTTEFLWQEGHTVHATEEDAERETLLILHEVYADFVEKDMAIPVIRGLKSEKEKFPGALRSYCIEAMMQDGRALQAGTSHNLGQNFARAFDITYTDQHNTIQYAWTTSWGVSTRLIGALIMTHSDDEGLVIPPRLAPTQVVVVPIYRNDAERSVVMEAVQRMTAEWKGLLRFKVDDRDNLTPGFKFNEWELKGVPIRVEIGPKDIEKGSVAIARRDQPGREGKSFVPQEGLTARLAALLEEIQQALYRRALAFRETHTADVTTYEELKQQVERGFARCYWAGTMEDEKRIQEETRATIRCIPLDQPQQAGRCIYTGKETTQQVIFARAY
ncbi:MULTISPECIES: proline--tRNA ligase [Roseiflexus]|uniref:Proline--tRNA ligase n=1 Tax=Roseiflexus castenholzii (strain DSM 13941 / HLO8) TaxID=383372 RepID=SYP_ROSCS|nr:MULTISPECIES: proline--tRNA ligase [Roseiflexus]A7NKX0.1 RecName: Full=Proline--tRNA ligase; AltName: Full=Prolyl-tRNA synthetase; Short=ProRS [Roseiflexus castenholzii DSM 13941]ABU58140.1 prolyl-tRNA synthetase [Roseiflexus castenholzii DSM 13941]PMP75105.1 MAG: proline--tRNA ligase [Roseiflexus castenholzii]GIW01058.1 MAG: proline--tRNA ligase [Roseiflexus sp.]